MTRVEIHASGEFEYTDETWQRMAYELAAAGFDRVDIDVDGQDYHIQLVQR